MVFLIYATRLACFAASARVAHKACLPFQRTLFVAQSLLWKETLFLLFVALRTFNASLLGIDARKLRRHWCGAQPMFHPATVSDLLACGTSRPSTLRNDLFCDAF